MHVRVYCFYLILNKRLWGLFLDQVTAKINTKCTPKDGCTNTV